MASESARASIDAFKAAMRRFATGVTIVTTTHQGHNHGFTANAFTSVSADPPTILICVNRSAATHAMIAQSGIFCVNILALEGRAIAERFATSHVLDKFEGVPFGVGRTGAPILADALAYFDCTLTEEHTAGTHTVFLGHVIGVGARNGSPLGYFDGTYRDFSLHVS